MARNDLPGEADIDQLVLKCEAGCTSRQASEIMDAEFTSLDNPVGCNAWRVPSAGVRESVAVLEGNTVTLFGGDVRTSAEAVQDAFSLHGVSGFGIKAGGSLRATFTQITFRVGLAGSPREVAAALEAGTVPYMEKDGRRQVWKHVCTDGNGRKIATAMVSARSVMFMGCGSELDMVSAREDIGRTLGALGIALEEGSDEICNITGSLDISDALGQVNLNLSAIYMWMRIALSSPAAEGGFGGRVEGNVDYSPDLKPMLGFTSCHGKHRTRYWMSRNGRLSMVGGCDRASIEEDMEFLTAGALASRAIGARDLSMRFASGTSRVLDSGRQNTR